MWLGFVVWRRIGGYSYVNEIGDGGGVYGEGYYFYYYGWDGFDYYPVIGLKRVLSACLDLVTPVVAVQENVVEFVWQIGIYLRKKKDLSFEQEPKGWFLQDPYHRMLFSGSLTHDVFHQNFRVIYYFVKKKKTIIIISALNDIDASSLVSC